MTLITQAVELPLGVETPGVARDEALSNVVPLPTQPTTKVKKAARPKAEKKKKRSNNVEFSANNRNYMSPDAYIERGQYVVGGRFDLDIASCQKANERVNARHWFGPDHPNANRQCALKRKSWGSRTQPNSFWENPPGGFLKLMKGRGGNRWKPVECGGESSQNLFLERTIEEWRAGNIWGIYLSFNPEVAIRKHGYLLKEIPYCLPADRPSFVKINDAGDFEPDKGNRKYAVVYFFPPTNPILRAETVARFLSDEGFGAIGECNDPQPAPDLSSAMSIAQHLSDEDVEKLAAYLKGRLTVAAEGDIEAQTILSQDGTKEVGWYEEQPRSGTNKKYKIYRYWDNGKKESVYVPVGKSHVARRKKRTSQKKNSGS